MKPKCSSDFCLVNNHLEATLVIVGQNIKLLMEGIDK